MFARFTIIHTYSEKVDEAAQLFSESVVPAFKSQNGFNMAYFISNRSEGKSICISIWDSEEDALNNERSLAYEEQLVKFMGLFTEPPYKEGYEVIVQSA